MKQPTTPTGNPLDYRCPSCGLFPGEKCQTYRGAPHKRRVEVANGTRPMVPDDAPDTNKWLIDFVVNEIKLTERQARSRTRKAHFLSSVS
jgi:hypothetical protein